jgi:HK97 family phage major capsid protein
VKESQDLLAKAAVNNSTLTAEELAVDDKLHKRIETINAEIKRYERITDSDRVALTDLSDGSNGSTPPAIRSFGEFLQAIACASSPVIRNRVPNGSEMVDRLNTYAAASGMSVGAPADGGYLVRKDWSAALLTRAREQAVLLPRCKSIDIGGDFDGLEYPYIDESSRVDGSRWGGVQVYWKSEAATRSRPRSRRSARASSGSRKSWALRMRPNGCCAIRRARRPPL